MTIRVSVMRLVLIVVLMMSAGCGIIGEKLSGIYVSDAEWLSDGWVYYIREVDSDGRELWRQRDSDDSKMRLFTSENIRVGCDDIQAIVPIGESVLGIELDCPGGTELIAYTPDSGDLRQFSSVLYASGAALDSDGNGYVEVDTECGTAIRPFRDGVVESFGKQATVAGRTLPIDGVNPPDCHTGTAMQSPAINPNGGLIFLVALDSSGKLPIRDSEEELWWQLVVWDGSDAAARVVAEMGKAAAGSVDAVASPDGKFVLVSIRSASYADDDVVWAVDASTGEKKQMVKKKPICGVAISPDSDRFVYADNKSHKLRFKSLK